MKQNLPLGFELFHNIKEIIINLWLIPKLQFHLIQIGEGIFNLRNSHQKKSLALQMLTMIYE